MKDWVSTTKRRILTMGSAIAVVALAGGFCSSPAHAWGREGHAIVAAIAEAHLNPVARAEVQRLLAIEPGATMESIAAWADQHRNRDTARWHFTNFPEGECHYRPERDCASGECLVNAVDNEAEILGDRSQSDEVRERALKYVIHLAGGDSSQPLHNYGPGKGANAYQVRFDGRGTNLHSVWDSGLIREMARTRSWFGMGPPGKPDYRALTERLVKKSMSMPPASSTDPQDWAEAACAVANSPGLLPSRSVGDAYVQRWTPVVEQQLLTGGLDLAALLNLELSGKAE